MKILVVDPDRVSRRLVELLLARMDMPPPVFADAIDAAPNGQWDLVLVDGGALADQAGAVRHRFGSHARLVALVAQLPAPAAGLDLQAVADEVVVKPLTRDVLSALCARSGAVVEDFDPVVWQQMRELFGTNGAAKLQAALAEDLPQQQARLASAIERDDLPAIKQIAHALRGVGLQFGATALAEQWTHVEQAAQAGDAQGAQALAAQLITRHAALVARVCDETRPG